MKHEPECWDNEKLDPDDWPQYCICDRLESAYRRGCEDQKRELQKPTLCEDKESEICEHCFESW